MSGEPIFGAEFGIGLPRAASAGGTSTKVEPLGEVDFNEVGEFFKQIPGKVEDLLFPPELRPE